MRHDGRREWPSDRGPPGGHEIAVRKMSSLRTREEHSSLNVARTGGRMLILRQQMRSQSDEIIAGVRAPKLPGSCGVANELTVDEVDEC